ncbi:MAG: hypothetical protein F6K10_07605 [Moorea sp. SIO2B7]|nr:hypothetical protein [Moorena sp. SIO2B7]
MKFQSSVKRFLSGAALGLFSALMAWFYSAFAHVSISPIQGLMGILFLTVSYGTIAIFTDFDTLINNWYV